MSVRIGHASIDSRGKISGDAAGDQNGKEVCIRQWYSKPWSTMLRPVSRTVAEKSATACEAACNNPSFGYDQSQRNTAHTEAKKVGYDLSKVTTPCETDCSAFMTLCALAAGVKGLEYTGNAPTTSTMVNAFTKTGEYQKYTDSKYLTSDEYLLRGDILVKPGSHTVMVLDDGAKAKTTTAPSVSNGYPKRGVDVSAYQKGVNYKQLKDNGVQFAIVKIINKSNQKDQMFETHWSGFSGVGIPCDVYNYSYATSVEKAEQDARAVIAALNGRKCTVYLDLEDKCIQGIGERLPQISNAYQRIIEDAGCKFAIYSGLSFVKSFLKPYINQLNCKQLWCARYYRGYDIMSINEVLDDSKKPVVQGFDLIGWQYTSSGNIGGYNGRLDMSVMYKEVSKNKGSDVQVGFVTNCKSLTVRNAPSKEGKALGYLSSGTKVLIYETAPNGWRRIHPTESQWCSGSYIDVQ